MIYWKRKLLWATLYSFWAFYMLCIAPPFFALQTQLSSLRMMPPLREQILQKHRSPPETPNISGDSVVTANFISQQQQSFLSVTSTAILEKEKEIFPLPYYDALEQQGRDISDDLFLTPTKPLPMHTFDKTIGAVIERDILQRRKQGWRLVVRADGLDRIGLFLVDFACFDLVVPTQPKAQTRYATKDSWSTASYLFGKSEFTQRLFKYVKLYISRALTAHPFAKVMDFDIPVTACVRVHLACPSVESISDAHRSHSFRTLTASASVIVKSPSKPANWTPFADDLWNVYATIFYPLTQDWSPWTAFMVYGHDFLQNRQSQSLTSTDDAFAMARGLQLIFLYQQLQQKSKELSIPDFPSFVCPESVLFEKHKLAGKVINVAHCVHYPFPLQVRHLAMVYFGWYPVGTFAVYYRLFSYKGKLQKIHLTRECTKDGWAQPTAVGDFKKGEEAYRDCLGGRLQNSNVLSQYFGDIPKLDAFG